MVWELPLSLVRSGQAVPEGLHLCTINPAGFIETVDGARIRFDGRGYGLRNSEKYQTSLTLIFSTEDVRYEWLTKVVAVMEGDFDEKTGRATIGERGLAIFLRMRSCMPQSTPFE